MKTLVQKMLHKVGMHIERYPHPDVARRMRIIDLNNIDIIFDIGANTGQYGKQVREHGYKGKIVSFEPLSQAFEELSKNTSRDNNWFASNYALGDQDKESYINIAGNSYSSSILDMMPLHIESAPESKFVTQEKIEIKKLDSVFDSFCDNNDKHLMLKIDSQGYGKNIIDGATNAIQKTAIIQLEMSLVPLYQNEMLFTQAIEYLESKGFMLYSIENEFANSTTGQLLQVDGIFVRKTGIRP